MQRTFRHRTALTLALLAVALSTGCSESFAPLPAADTDSPAPNFSGPHRELFREIWDKTPEKKLREMIRDEHISDHDWAEVTDGFSQCVAAHGMAATEITLGGGFTVSYLSTPPATGDVEIEKCKQSSGLTAIGILHSEQITNPDNKDFDELMSACLVRAKVVPPSYNPDDWRRESARPPTGPGYELDYVVPKASGDVAAEACSEDPTHSYQ